MTKKISITIMLCLFVFIVRYAVYSFLYFPNYIAYNIVNILSLCILGVCFYLYFRNNLFLKNTFVLSKKLEYYWFGSVVFIGILLRVLYFGSIPNGLNPDELSMLYDSYSLGRFGIDRNGHFLPVYLEAWGGGQSALLAYLTIPFVMIFGMNAVTVRIVSLLFSIIDLFVIYFLLQNISSRKIALIGASLFAICPWGIMIAKWGLDCNLLASLLLYALYFLVKAIKHNHWWLCLATFFWGLALYSYAISWLFLPIFLLGLYTYMLLRKKIHISSFLLANSILFCFALPLILFIMVNNGWLAEFQFLGIFTIPKLSGYRGAELGFSYQNLLDFCRMFFLQNDQFLWNTVSGVGFLYIVCVPFAIFGYIKLCQLTKQEWKEKLSFNAILLFWVTLSILLSLIIKNPNVNKTNMLWIPVYYCVALGIDQMLFYSKFHFVSIISIFCVMTILFCSVYYVKNNDYNTSISVEYNLGLIEATKFAENVQHGQTIYCSQSWESYIYTLVANQTNPYEFCETVQYQDESSSFRKVLSYGSYRFGLEDVIPTKDNIYIVKCDQVNIDGVDYQNYFDESWAKETFGYFTVYYQK